MNLPTRKLWWLNLNLSNGTRESWLISRLLWGGKVQDWAVLQRQGCGGSMYTLHGVPPDISSTYWNVQSVNLWSSWSYAARRPKTARCLLQPTMMWALPGHLRRTTPCNTLDTIQQQVMPSLKRAFVDLKCTACRLPESENESGQAVLSNWWAPLYNWWAGADKL